MYFQRNEGDQTKYEKYGGIRFPPLKSLIDLAILFPAENVITVHHLGKVFTASLTTAGNIESKGGEIFNTPMKWLSAVKGGEVVKKSQAYREVKIKISTKYAEIFLLMHKTPVLVFCTLLVYMLMAAIGYTPCTSN